MHWVSYVVKRVGSKSMSNLRRDGWEKRDRADKIAPEVCKSASRTRAVVRARATAGALFGTTSIASGRGASSSYRHRYVPASYLDNGSKSAEPPFPAACGQSEDGS